MALYSYFHYSYYTVSVTETTGYSPTSGPYLDFNINFTATVFSAQNPIQVSVIAYFDPSFVRENASFIAHNVTDVLYFYLRGADFPTKQYSNLGAEIAPVILLHHQTDGSYRNESQTVIFEYEGYKCFTADTKPLQSALALCQGIEQPLIYISSVDSLLQLQTQHYTAALTWLFGAFAIAVCRDEIMGIGTSLATLYEQIDSRNDADPEKKKTEREKSQGNIPKEPI